MPAKRAVVAQHEVGNAITYLRSLGFDCVKVYFAPHKEHREQGIAEDRVLLYASHYVPRPSQKNKKVIVTYTPQGKEFDLNPKDSDNDEEYV